MIESNYKRQKQAGSFVIAVFLATVLQACGEMGSDPRGPNKAFYVLKGSDGVVRDFYLGGYNTVHECLEILSADTDFLDEKNDRFWTNPEFTYGGYPTGDDWVEYKGIGGKCTR